MSAKLIFTLIFAAAVLFFCYLLTRYWYRTGRYMWEKEAGNLRFGSKAAFALTHFWKAVDDAKELPKETVKGEMGSYRREEAEDRSGPVRMDSLKRTKEEGANHSRKKYRIKENM